MINSNNNQESGSYVLPDFNSLPFASLPSGLRKGIYLFPNEEDKILYTYSAITVCSALLTRVNGIYDDKEVFPNLFLMVVGEPASGKSLMLHARSLTRKVHDHFYQKSQLKKEEYNALPAKIKQKTSSPPFEVVVIPGNSSSSKLLKHLADNGSCTPSLMFESEIDTIGITNSTDFGNYSDILRKIFSNEPVSQSRRGYMDEYFEIESPKLSVALSGTLGQVVKFIKNREDGLFSRFLFVHYKGLNSWKQIGLDPLRPNLTKEFKDMSDYYFNMWDFFSKFDMQVNLSTDQWKKLNTYCELQFNALKQERSDNTVSLAKRHGVMLFKMCMTLTAMRQFENGISEVSVECKDEDFDTALFLTSKALVSSIEIYDSLPTTSYSVQGKVHLLYQNLPDQFPRNKAVRIGLQELNLQTRTLDRYLNKLVNEKLLTQPSAGVYKKVTQDAGGKVAIGK